jgi:hypothetical protein
MKPLSILIATAIALFSGASIAMADSSTDAYGGHERGIVSIVTLPAQASTTDPGSAHTVSGLSGSLPFTGLNLALVAGAGLALLGAGVGVRRLSRPRDSQV